MSVYRFISAEKARTPVSLACRVARRQPLGLLRVGDARARASGRSTDAWLTERIRAIHEAHRGVYGAPRIHADLRLAHGIRVARKRVERLMRAAGISGLVRRKRGRTTIRVPGVRVADDLVERQFRPAGAERAVDRRRHLPAHLGGLALPGRRPGRLLPPDRRLVDGRPHARRARRRRARRWRSRAGARRPG